MGFSQFSHPAMRIAGIGATVGGYAGIGLGLTHAHSVNKRRKGGVFARGGRYLGYGLLGDIGGSLAGAGLAGGGYLAYKAARSRFIK